MSVRQVRAILKHLVDIRRWDEDEIPARCNWHMERNRIAKLCHERPRRDELQRQNRKRTRVLSYERRRQNV